MATVVSKINSNFEKIGSIKVLSAAKSTRDEQAGLIFGGLAYTADVNANDGQGYTITIYVISEKGEYTINKNSLDATSKGSKNIQIGNFTFFDFFLVEYSIEKEIANSILKLTYKDKSIFMDKLFIGLLHHDYGVSINRTLTENRPPGIATFLEKAKFDYICDENKPENQTPATISRFLTTAHTSRPEFSSFPSTLLNSPYFHSEYNYLNQGVDGGFIIVGSEEFKEKNCHLPDTSYTFKDLLSALYFSKVPGLDSLSLPDSALYTKLRRSYYGTLRDVLSSWQSVSGLFFYFQPKIEYYTRDYSNLDATPKGPFIIKAGLRYIDASSSSQTLDNLTKFLNSNSSAGLKKVIQNYREFASLQGTVRSSVITSIRREARTFPRSIPILDSRIATPLGLENIPPLFGVDPTSNDFLVRATLGKYDPDLRDIYVLDQYANTTLKAGEFKSVPEMGMQIIFNLFTDQEIIDNLDFLAIFGNGFENASKVLDTYNVYLALYDPARHQTIIEWEKAILDSFYNQYFAIEVPESKIHCDGYNNYSTSYVSEPSSQRYSANELPFKELLFRKSELTKNLTAQKTKPIFKVDNPFDDRNEQQFNAYLQSFTDNQSQENNYSKYKSFKTINFAQVPTAVHALLKCIKNQAVWTSLFNIISNRPPTPGQAPATTKNTNNKYANLIIAPKLSSTGDLKTTISVDQFQINNSIITLTDLKNVSNDVNSANKNCDKTVCDEVVANTFCDKNENGQTSKITGFVNRDTSAVVLTRPGKDPFYLRIPTRSPYQYNLTTNINGTTTFGALSYVQGTPPSQSNIKLENNVLRYSVINNPAPDQLTQATKTDGIQSYLVTYDDKKPTERVIITNIFDYCDTAAKELNSSILEPQEVKNFSLISTYIPEELKNYIFDNNVLNEIRFNLTKDGFLMNFGFQSRPRQMKEESAVFETQNFLRKL